MLIPELIAYLQERKEASLDELCFHFSVEPATMKGILSEILAAGNTPLTKTPSCGQCRNCRCHQKKQYRWTDGDIQPAAIQHH